MKLHNILIFMCVFFILSGNSYADCDLWVYSSQDLPVSGVAVYFRNITDNSTLSNTTTNSAGRAVFSGNCINVSVRSDYPSTSYSAVLTNVSAYPAVHINHWIAGRVQLRNTLGQYLDGQDCSVTVYAHNTSILIHDYDTQCQTGEPYVDKNGNWASITNCVFTDSMGWYYFKGRTDEAMGYEYDKKYDLVFVCNGETIKTTFFVDLERQIDTHKIEDFAQRYGGVILLGILVGVFLLGVVCIIIYFLNRSQKKRN